MKERHAGLTFIQRIRVRRAVAAGGVVDPPVMSVRYGGEGFGQEVLQAEAERALPSERAAVIRVVDTARGGNEPPPGASGSDEEEEPDTEGSERSTDDVLEDWEDLEGWMLEEDVNLFEVPAEGSRMQSVKVFGLGDKDEAHELVAAALPLTISDPARDELDRCQVRLQAVVKSEAGLHVEAIMHDFLDERAPGEVLRRVAQQPGQPWRFYYTYWCLC